MKTTDIKSAFLQGKKMDREVYLSPPRDANVPDGTLWKLRHCLYCLNDAARQFYQSVVDILKTLNCLQSSLDLALFFLKQGNELFGMIACHIDDFLHAGHHELDNEVMSKVTEHFWAGKLQEIQFRYIGFDIHQTPNGILLEQTNFVKDLKIPKVSIQRTAQKQEDLSSEEYTKLRSLVGRLNWVVQGS